MSLSMLQKFQSTFPRGERRSTISTIRICDMISIHVPSWGTTSFLCRFSIVLVISIHVPSWGTTSLHMCLFAVSCISIHVPSWGTTSIVVRFSVFQSFQSTFPRGERRLLPSVTHLHCSDFNPRSLVGNDEPLCVNSPSWQNFNPRSLVGNDVSFSYSPGYWFISIHVPSWGTTL